MQKEHAQLSKSQSLPRRSHLNKTNEFELMRICLLCYYVELISLFPTAFACWATHIEIKLNEFKFNPNKKRILLEVSCYTH